MIEELIMTNDELIGYEVLGDDWKNVRVIKCVYPLTEVRGEMSDLKLKSRAFIEEIKKLASKYELPFFIVTAGASAYSNNGVEAIKHARESHKEWERQHGLDPDDDWNHEHE
jgi:tagatose-1,6-bisphosphate aldolase